MYDIFLVIEKRKVTGYGICKFFNRPAFLRLLPCIPRKVYTHLFKDNLCKPAAIHTQR